MGFMSILNIWLIIGYLLSKLIPYLCMFLIVATHRAQKTKTFPAFEATLVLALACFILASAPIVATSLTAYRSFSILLTLIAFLWIFRHISIYNRLRTDPIATAIAILAALSRLIPPLVGGEPFGMGDARYHNLISQMVVLQGHSPTTWEPFADIGIMYPQGIHTLMAATSTAHIPVHEVFAVCFAPVAGLTVLAIYRLTKLITGSTIAGRLSAICYAFLPIWNSLDYYAWGGLPNAIGMLFLLEFIIITLQWMTSETPPHGFALLPPALLFAAMLATHHYTIIVGGLYGLSFLLCCGSTALRKTLFKVAALSLLPCAYSLIRHYIHFAPSIGTTGVFVYREEITRVTALIMGLSPPLVILFAIVMLAQRRTTWSPLALVILAWFAALLLTFVLLNHGYRAAVFLATGGKDMFTAFTPSRMAATLVYPMSILSGFLVLTPLWTKHRRLFTVCLGLSCVAMTTSALSSQIHGDEFPAVAEVGSWISTHTPQNAMLVGILPNIEYAAWRETSNPPLPASERRNDPSVTWKQAKHTYAEWLQWEHETGRRVFFLLKASDAAPLGLIPVHTNSDVAVYESAPTP